MKYNIYILAENVIINNIYVNAIACSSGIKSDTISCAYPDSNLILSLRAFLGTLYPPPAVDSCPYVLPFTYMHALISCIVEHCYISDSKI